jgi:hypothetical protein
MEKITLRRQQLEANHHCVESTDEKEEGDGRQIQQRYALVILS